MQLLAGLSDHDPTLPLVCLETALPVKFEQTMIEALGRRPARPARFEGIEAREQHVTTLPADVNCVKTVIRDHIGPIANDRRSA